MARSAGSFSARCHSQGEGHAGPDKRPTGGQRVQNAQLFPQAGDKRSQTLDYSVLSPRDNLACGREPGSSPDGEQSGSRFKAPLPGKARHRHPPPAIRPQHIRRTDRGSLPPTTGRPRTEFGIIANGDNMAYAKALNRGSGPGALPDGEPPALTDIRTRRMRHSPMR